MESAATAPSQSETSLGAPSLRHILLGEASAMAEAALNRGKEVPAGVVKTIEVWRGVRDGGGAGSDEQLAELVAAHHTLAQLIAPATPRTMRLLQLERRSGGRFKMLGPVPLIRHLMVAALVSLAAFVAVCLTHYTDYQPGCHRSIMTMSGVELLMNLLQYLAAAGLGASFLSLYKANRFVTEGTFDPMYVASYWIRFCLGLIAGLMLAVVINEDIVGNNPGATPVLESGIVRVLLAMLGGFSADLFYTFLNRFVEAFKSLFEGAAGDIVKAKVEHAKIQLAGQLMEDRLQHVAKLLRLQQSIGAASTPEEIRRELDGLMNQLLPAKTGGLPAPVAPPPAPAPVVAGAAGASKPA